MTAQEIKMLSVEEKQQIMEAIWEDMRDRHDRATISPETIALLRFRQERVAQEEAKILDWDQVKSAIGRG